VSDGNRLPERDVGRGNGQSADRPRRRLSGGQRRQAVSQRLDCRVVLLQHRAHPVERGGRLAIEIRDRRQRNDGIDGQRREIEVKRTPREVAIGPRRGIRGDDEDEDGDRVDHPLCDRQPFDHPGQLIEPRSSVRHIGPRLL
jgi:hypothetical protein